MRTIGKWVLALAVVALGMPRAFADPQPGREAKLKLGLLHQKSVRGELRLSPEQIKKVEDFTLLWRKALRELLDLPVGERPKKEAELAQQVIAFLSKTLEAKQVMRLTQIYLQIFGILAIQYDPAVSKALRLTEEQRKRLTEVSEHTEKTMAEIGGMRDVEEMRQKFAALRKEQQEKVWDTLTMEQKQEWKKLTGEPFTGTLEPAGLVRPTSPRKEQRP